MVKRFKNIFLWLLVVGIDIVLANLNINTLKKSKNIDKKTINNKNFSLKTYDKRDDCHTCDSPCSMLYCCSNSDNPQCCLVGGECYCCPN